MDYSNINVVQQKVPTITRILNKSHNTNISASISNDDNPPLESYIPIKTFSNFLTNNNNDISNSDSSNTIDNVSIHTRLHNEIIRFYNLIKPHDYSNIDSAIRKNVVKKYSNLLKKLFDHIDVFPFGSYVTGLYLSNSDIDLVVISKNSNKGLDYYLKKTKKFFYGLYPKVIKNCEVIAHARIPLIKIVDSETGIKLDISFKTDSGIISSNFIKKIISSIPSFKYLFFVLKYFLAYRDLHETYRGGVGSYLLQLLLLSLYQLHPLYQNENSTLGQLLLAFFEFYGCILRYNKLGISVRTGGRYYKKKDKDFTNYNNNLLSVENPFETSLDVGANSFNYFKVRDAFQCAFFRLMESSNNSALLSILFLIDVSLIPSGISSKNNLQKNSKMIEIKSKDSKTKKKKRKNNEISEVVSPPLESFSPLFEEIDKKNIKKSKIPFLSL